MLRQGPPHLFLEVPPVAAAEVVERTGVEMEALTAVSVALLTAYDMLKAVDRAMTLGPIRLEEKRGGKSVSFARQQRVTKSLR
mgnify:CR=1 FL=1